MTGHASRKFATLWWAVLVGFVALALLRRRFPGLMQEGNVKADSDRTGLEPLPSEPPAALRPVRQFWLY